MFPFQCVVVRFIPLLLIAACVTLAACSESKRRAHPSLSETPAYSKAGSYTDESTLVQKSAEELTSAGFAYLAAGNATLARMNFVTALKRDPETAQAYIGLGDISYQSEDYPSALTNYQKAASIDKDNLAAILGQAKSLRQEGKLHLATEQVNLALKLAPNDVNVLTELAINYDLQGQENLAAPLYREIAVKTPDQAAVYNNIGVNEMAQGQYPEAIVNFSKAFMLDDKDQRITNNLAMAFALYGQGDQAMKLFSKTVGEAAGWNNLGYIYMTQNRLDEAEEALRKALELNPKFYKRAQDNLDRVEQMRSLSRHP